MTGPFVGPPVNLHDAVRRRDVELVVQRPDVIGSGGARPIRALPSYPMQAAGAAVVASAWQHRAVILP